MSSRGPPLNPSKTASGIAVDPRTLDRVIPESRRSDGSVRKERKIRPGFTPQEDVQRFRSTRQQAVESRQNTVVGWISPSRAPTSPPSSSSSRATSAGGGGGAARKSPTSPSGAIARSALAAAGIGAAQGGGGGGGNSKAARKNEKRREKRREKREAEAEEVAENWDSDEDVGKKDVKVGAGEAKDAAVGNGGGGGAEDEKGKEQDDVGEVADKLGGLAVKE